MASDDHKQLLSATSRIVTVWSMLSECWLASSAQGRRMAVWSKWGKRSFGRKIMMLKRTDRQTEGRRRDEDKQRKTLPTCKRANYTAHVWAASPVQDANRAEDHSSNQWWCCLVCVCGQNSLVTGRAGESAHWLWRSQKVEKRIKNKLQSGRAASWTWLDQVQEQNGENKMAAKSEQVNGCRPCVDVWMRKPTDDAQG